MKRFNVLAIFFLFAVAFSCKKEGPEIVKVDEARILSFGFYAEDNPGILLKDYVVTNITSNNITVLLPEDVDKTKLIARFALGENNVVKINNVAQVSGETSNDFTIPLDYFLTHGNTNARYTVSIGKAPAFIWVPIQVPFEETLTAIVLKVNPVTSVPYLMYSTYRSPSALTRAGMAKFENNTWENMGDISDGQVSSDIAFTFNSAGIPYAAYVDYTAPVSRAHTVRKFNAGSWDLVGNKGITTGRATFAALSFVNDEKLMLFSTFDATGGALARRELDISVFENDSWTTNLTMPGRASNMVAYNLVSVKKGDAVYLGVYNAISPNTISVYKYQNSTWTPLIDKWSDPKGTGINLRDFDIDVDNQGNVYAAFADNSQDAVFKHRVIKYNEQTGLVTSVGSYLPGASGNLFNFDLALSPLGTPYLLYRNENNYPAIVYLDKESQDWGIPYVFEPQVADELNLSFTPNGEAYVMYLKSRQLFTYKYVAP